MGVLFITISALLQQAEGMTMRRYGKKHSVGGMFFNAIISLAAMVFFFLTDKNGLHFPKEMWIYGSIDALFFASGFYSMFLALQSGSFVATKMVSSFSGIFPIVYGIAFLKEPADFFIYLGIVLVFLSMFFMNYSKKGIESSQDKKAFSLKWLICVLVTSVANGGIGILTRMQQIHFGGAYDNEFMILSFGGSFLFLLLLSLLQERDRMGYILKHGTPYGLLTGLINGSKNLIGMLVYFYIPISLASPIRTGIDLIMSFLISILLYKEKLTKMQLASVAIGAVALVLFAL
ncbi:MAG: DMT family transporter [Clostridia bacterium]|nr:DMT family transporter [Clostridia bacterium]